MPIPVELAGLLSTLQSRTRRGGEGGARLTVVEEAAQAKPVPGCPAKKPGLHHHGRYFQMTSVGHQD